MYYNRTEEYSFRVPQEYTAYLAFKNNLKESSVRFTEEGGHTHQTIIIRTNGRFDVQDGQVFFKDGKEV